MKIKLEIFCGDKLLNEHSFGGTYYGYNNPFGDVMPCVGDIVELGGKCFPHDTPPLTAGKRYKVIRRIFKAYETYNNSYSDQKCILEVEEYSEKIEWK